MARVFFSYAHEDEELRDELEIHLAMLRRQGFIESFHDGVIKPGRDFERRIRKEIDAADIILLLLSPDFLASDYCYDIEKSRALRRHRNKEAQLVPVILRPCQWKYTALRRLKALPKDGKPITKWANRDAAFNNVAEGIRKLVG